MVTIKNFLICFVFLLLNSCTSSQILNNGKTKVPRDFSKIKSKCQLNKFSPLNNIYVEEYHTIGKKDFSINEDAKPSNYNNSFKTFIKFYDNGNVNFFYLQDINYNSFDPDFDGDRGFYYFIDKENFIIKIYVKTDDWGGKSFKDYYGKIDGDKILLRTKQNFQGKDNFILEVYKKTDFQTPKTYKANW